jgi:hypothetical protein
VDSLSLAFLVPIGLALTVGFVITARHWPRPITKDYDYLECRLDQRAALPRAKVMSYRVEYGIGRNWYLYYTLEGDRQAQRLWVTPEDLVALIHMLRYEGPVYFNSGERYFVTKTRRLPAEQNAPAA